MDVSAGVNVFYFNTLSFLFLIKVHPLLGDYFSVYIWKQTIMPNSVDVVYYICYACVCQTKSEACTKHVFQNRFSNSRSYEHSTYTEKWRFMPWHSTNYFQANNVDNYLVANFDLNLLVILYYNFVCIFQNFYCMVYPFPIWSIKIFSPKPTLVLISFWVSNWRRSKGVDTLVGLTW